MQKLYRTIFLSGLLVGTLDILAACTEFYIKSGKNPTLVLKFIASGVFGKKAYTGGSGMIWLGLLFHYIIAFGFTILFFWLYPRLAWMRKNWIITGIVYGIFIWLFMHYIVVPLSNTPTVQRKPYGFIKSIAILIIMIGIPLSYIAQRYYKIKNNTK